MKKTIFFWAGCCIAALLITGSHGIEANECDPCFKFGNVELEVDFLWWKICTDDLEYAAEDHQPDDTRFLNHKKVCPGWEPAVRLGLNIPSICRDIGLRATYTYLHSEAHSSISGDTDTIISSLIHPNISRENLGDKAKGSWDATYHEWDLLAYTEFCPKNSHLFRPFLGIAGIVLDQELKSEFFDITNYPDAVSDTSKWNSDFWGVGLRLGTDYEYRCSDCLSFYSSLHGTFLAGSHDSGYDFTLEIEDRDDLETDDDGCCLFVPGYHATLGILYHTCLCGRDLALRLGYEFLGWNNLPKNRMYTNSGSGTRSHSTSSSGRTLGIHGLTGGIALSF